MKEINIAVLTKSAKKLAGFFVVENNEHSISIHI